MDNSEDINSFFDDGDMDQTEKNFFLDIYKECLEKKYYNPALGSLNNLLHEIIREFDNRLIMNQPLLSSSSYMASYIKSLINIFTKIINDKKENQVYDAYKLILELSLLSNYYRMEKDALASYFECIFYPKEAYIKCNFQYCLLINNIIENYAYFKNYGYRCVNQNRFSVLDPYFVKILDFLRDYHAGIIKGDRQESTFCRLMNLVVAYFYKEKYDISLFPKVLDYVYNNLDQVCEFFLLNNRSADSNEVEKIYIGGIIEACTKDIPVIK